MSSSGGGGGGGGGGRGITGVLSDGTFVVFFVLNIVQILTIFTILIYAVVDVYRRCHSVSAMECSTSSIMGSMGQRNNNNNNVAFVSGCGLSKDAVLKFRNMIEPERVGRLLLGAPDIKGRAEQDDSANRTGLLAVLKNGPGDDASIEDENEMHTQDTFIKMGRDPVLYMASAVSKFARDYSPFRAKAFVSSAQLSNRLVYPQVVECGTALVLPTGHVINKAKNMTDEDMDTWNYSPPQGVATRDIRKMLTRQCAAAPPVHRINVYGFAGSRENRAALEDSSVEMLLCNCDTHTNLLQAPSTATYSSVRHHIQLDVAKKTVLFPGPGSEPLRSRQVTATSHQISGAKGEYDLHNIPVEVSNSGDPYVSSESSVTFKPVYGAGLVNLPIDGAPIRMNCPCTDRPDGVYTVVNKRTRDTPASSFLQRDIAAYFNANPVDVYRFTIEGGADGDPDFVARSWLATGKNIAAITCKDETIKNIK